MSTANALTAAEAKRTRRRARNLRAMRNLRVAQGINALNRATETTMHLHREALVRTREGVGGSYVEGLDSWAATQRFLRDLDWQEVPWSDLPDDVGKPVARYFRAALPPEAVAFKVTMTVAEARAWGYSLRVETRKPSDDPDDPNPRGLAIYARPPKDPFGQSWDKVLTKQVWAITGAKPGVLWTWHPGAPAAPVTKAHYEALDEGDWSAPELQEVNVHLPLPPEGVRR